MIAFTIGFAVAFGGLVFAEDRDGEPAITVLLKMLFVFGGLFIMSLGEVI